MHEKDKLRNEIRKGLMMGFIFGAGFMAICVNLFMMIETWRVP